LHHWQKGQAVKMHDKKHPADDIITMAAVDMSLIGKDEKRHIGSCQACAEKYSRLVSGLENLGAFASKGIPRMTSPIRLEHKASRGIPGWLWGTALGATLCASLVLIVLNIPDPRQALRYQPAPQAYYKDRHAEDMLISEVGMIIDNPLPEG
jgi:hypothetical protein